MAPINKFERFRTSNYDNKEEIFFDENDFKRIIAGDDSGEWFTHNINGKDLIGSAYHVPNENRLYHVFYDEDFNHQMDDEVFDRVKNVYMYYDNDTNKRKSKKLSKNSIVDVLSASISNFTLNGETVNVFLTNDGVYVGLRSNYDNQGHYDNSDGSLLFVSSLEGVFHTLFGSGWVDTFEELSTTMPSPEEVNRVRDYLARLGYLEQRFQTFGDGKGWDDYRASTKKSKNLSKSFKFESLYNAYSNLGESESTALMQVLKDAGFMGFAELCDRAKMLCYEADSESKSASFNDMVKSVRSVNKSRLDNDDATNVHKGHRLGTERYDDIRQPIRDWYLNAYPTDDLGHSISDITFDDLYSGLSSGLDVYDRMGVGDSVIRERLFDRLAELKGVTYGDIYDLWLSMANKGVRKSSATMSKRDNMGKSQLLDDYPNHSDGPFVVHRKVNQESMYPYRFNNHGDYERFCRNLENMGWTRGKEYVDNDGAEVTYIRDTD